MESYFNKERGLKTIENGAASEMLQPLSLVTSPMESHNWKIRDGPFGHTLDAIHMPTLCWPGLSFKTIFHTQDKMHLSHICCPCPTSPQFCYLYLFSLIKCQQ